jgi:hypothetical protein
MLMHQLKARGHPDQPPAISTDGKGAYREAMVETWGTLPPYGGYGRPPTHKQPHPDWQYVQVVKERIGYRLVGVHRDVIYGDRQTVLAITGGHTSYIERTHLTSRQMNGRLVRKTLSFSKHTALLRASCAWEDGVYNFTRSIKTLRVADCTGDHRWQPRTPAMAAHLTDHPWSLRELLETVVVPRSIMIQQRISLPT